VRNEISVVCHSTLKVDHDGVKIRETAVMMQGIPGVISGCKDVERLSDGMRSLNSHMVLDTASLPFTFLSLKKISVGCKPPILITSIYNSPARLTLHSLICLQRTPFFPLPPLALARPLPFPFPLLLPRALLLLRPFPSSIVTLPSFPPQQPSIWLKKPHNPHKP
jgi:hypothetical protein